MSARAQAKVAAAVAILAAAATASDASAVITIDGTGPASPYPSTIEVSGLNPIVEDVEVRIHNLEHPFVDELDMAVVGPGGQGVMLMSDVGSIDGTCKPDLRFDDQASGPVPIDVLPCDGTYLPTDDDGDVFDSDLFPAPAPEGPFGTSLSALNASDPNGTWSLYVMDDTEEDGGGIGSWGLHLNTRPAGVVRLSGVMIPATEGRGPVHVRLRRSGASTLAPLRAGSVTWAVVTCPPFPALPDGAIPPALPAATAERDFSPSQGSVDLAPGETEKELELELTDDHVPEGRECVALQLGSPAGDARVIPPGDVASVVISDNDPPASAPSVKVGPAQRVLRRKAVIVMARSRAYGTLAARGTIALPRHSAAAIRLNPASASVTAGQPVALKLRLSKQALRAVRRAFARQRILKANVTVIATDLAGGRAARTVSIKLRR